MPDAESKMKLNQEIAAISKRAFFIIGFHGVRGIG